VTADINTEITERVAQIDVRGDDGGPAPMNRWVADADTTTVRLCPDEWLVLSDSLTPAELAHRLRGSGSLVDVSAQRTVLRLTGPDARDVLSAGCALDLAAFPPGSAAQTTLAKAGIVLLAEEDGYRVLVRSSFAHYLTEWLADAATTLDAADAAGRPGRRSRAEGRWWRSFDHLLPLINANPDRSANCP
jgi:sarcosine oxidase subunit gamma